MNQIRYCHARELASNPNLGGKIVIKFVVAKDGSVNRASVKSNTMENDAVAQCAMGRFLRMQFPKPLWAGES